MIVAKPVTGEDLIDMPFDGVERYVIKGELREYPVGVTNPDTGELMSVRNRLHARAANCTGRHLGNWLADQPEPRGEVLNGDAGVRLDPAEDTTFGVDVMYVSAEVLAAQTGESTIIQGVPTLTVEILSPSETFERVDEKTDAYLAAGVPLVWLLDLHDKSVTVYRPGAEPETFNRLADLTAEPHLPGFRVKVGNLFE